MAELIVAAMDYRMHSYYSVVSKMSMGISMVSLPSSAREDEGGSCASKFSREGAQNVNRRSHHRLADAARPFPFPSFPGTKALAKAAVASEPLFDAVKTRRCKCAKRREAETRIFLLTLSVRPLVLERFRSERTTAPEKTINVNNAFAVGKL